MKNQRVTKKILTDAAKASNKAQRELVDKYDARENQTTKGMTELSKKIRCKKCKQYNVKVTSAFDGRPEYRCLCGYTWTNGRKPNQGYAWKKNL